MGEKLCGLGGKYGRRDMMGESWEEDDKAAKMGGKTIYSGDGCWAVVTIVE